MHNDKMTFVSSQWAGQRRLTKGELAFELYPSKYFEVDHALPHAWLQKAVDSGMDDVTQHVVTVYPRQAAVDAEMVQSTTMFMAPVTIRGVEILSRLASTI